MYDIVTGREFIEPEPAVAAARSTLIIGQDCPDRMTVKGVRALTFRWSDVAAEHEEQIRVALECIVNGLALRAKGCIEPVADDPVANDNRPAVLVSQQQAVGPGQDRRVCRHG